MLGDPELRAGLQWGTPRPGHPEGTVSRHPAPTVRSAKAASCPRSHETENPLWRTAAAYTSTRWSRSFAAPLQRGAVTMRQTATVNADRPVALGDRQDRSDGSHTGTCLSRDLLVSTASGRALHSRNARRGGDARFSRGS